MLSFLINVFVVVLLVFDKSDSGNNININQLHAKYPLLSRRVLIEQQNDILINFLSLRTSLQKQLGDWDNKFNLYFEYLPTGTSIGVNSTDQFYAASLFKVPVIMAYYHYLERTGMDRNQNLVIKKEDLDKDFGNLWKKGAGATVSSKEAIRLALEESDNTAAKVIARQVNDQDFNSVYKAIDLDLHTGSGGAIITTRDYSTILKALYFSSVLNKDDSNEILTYLTHTNFNDKLVAGIPANIPIAHKIGDYRDAKNSKAYYDCGIVYLPKRLYLLCMTSVSDEKTANERMKMISKKVYEYVSSVKN